MAVSMLKMDSMLKPTTSGWQVGFLVRGLGFVVIIPCDTRYYNVTIRGTAKVFLSTGWVDLTNGSWNINDYGSYYLLAYSGSETPDSLDRDVYLTSIVVNVTAK